MDKTSEKVTKDPKRVEAARRGREKYMNKLKESILNDGKKVVEIVPIQAMKLLALLTMQAMKLPALPTPPPPLPSPQDQMILLSMVLVCLLSLPSVLVYFFHITLFSLKIKNKPMRKRINHQNDVICFRKIYTINK